METFHQWIQRIELSDERSLPFTEQPIIKGLDLKFRSKALNARA